MQKYFTLDIWDGSEYAFAENRNRCKVSKKNPDASK